jgi:hypothetical protein
LKFTQNRFFFAGRILIEELLVDLILFRCLPMPVAIEKKSMRVPQGSTNDTMAFWDSNHWTMEWGMFTTGRTLEEHGDG